MRHWNSESEWEALPVLFDIFRLPDSCGFRVADLSVPQLFNRFLSHFRSDWQTERFVWPGICCAFLDFLMALHCRFPHFMDLSCIAHNAQSAESHKIFWSPEFVTWVWSRKRKFGNFSITRWGKRVLLWFVMLFFPHNLSFLCAFQVHCAQLRCLHQHDRPHFESQRQNWSTARGEEEWIISNRLFRSFQGFLVLRVNQQGFIYTMSILLFSFLELCSFED